MPEDPEKARAATAQWSEHLAEEEEGRKLRYDRDRLDEHEKVLSFFDKTLERYTRVRSKGELDQLQRSLAPGFDAVKKRISAIDKYKNSSGVLEHYAAMLGILENSLPAALAASFDSDRKRVDQLRTELTEHTERVDRWLARARLKKDEGAR